MDVFKVYATDETKEQSGVWCDIGDGAKLLVARAGNRKYARALSAQVEANQRALDMKNDASDALSDKIMIDVSANTVLLGWEGVEYQGEVLPYSVDNAKKLLAIKDFRLLVARLSNDSAAYKAAQEAEVVKN